MVWKTGRAAIVELDGRLPINTHGGQLGEACIHGMNDIGEAVRQIRSLMVNQVNRVEQVLVTSGTGVPTREQRAVGRGNSCSAVA